MAQLTEFPDCCGIIVVNRFKGGHPNSDPDDCDSPQVVGEFLAEQERQHYGYRAGLMAVLSGPQEERVGHVFRDRKWKLLLDGINNCRTGVKLFIYFRDLNPTTAREKRIFGR